MKKTLFIITIFFVALIGNHTLFAATVVDSSGNEIVITKPFRRIISLYPAHTENLASLGLDAEIIGIAANDDYPQHILHKQRFGYREDPEKFIAAGPDLVLVRPMIERSYPQLLTKLRQVGITVVSLQPTSVNTIYEYWQALGTLTGRVDQAEKMITAFKNELKTLQQTLPESTANARKRVYFEAIHKKMKTFAPESIAVFVLEQAGGVNLAADALRVRKTNIAYYGKERILAKAGRIDVFLAQQGRMNPVSRDEIMTEAGFQAIKAIQHGEVYLVDEKIVSRPTMRILEGIKKIRKILYPESVSNERRGGHDG